MYPFAVFIDAEKKGIVFTSSAATVFTSLYSRGSLFYDVYHLQVRVASFSPNKIKTCCKLEFTYRFPLQS